MADFWMLRGFAIVFGVAAVLIAWFLWINAGAADATKNSVIAFASLLTVVVALSSYVAVQPREDHFQAFLLYDNKVKAIIHGRAPSAYFYNFGPALNGMPLKAESIEAARDEGVDLIWRALLMEFSWFFATSWDYAFQKYSVPGGGEERRGVGSDLEGVPLTGASLNELFLRQSLNPSERAFSVPGGSTVRVRRGDRFREILVSHACFDATISVTRGNISVMQHDPSQVLPTTGDLLDGRYYSIGYYLDMTFRKNRWRANDPNMKAYERWYDNVRDVVRPFSWEQVIMHRARE
jgi:hypothetical protein